MLGKLLKHELKETARLLIPLNLILLGVAIFGSLVQRIELLKRDGLILIPTAVVFLYMLTIVTLFILTAVYLTIRFYKTMYASQGYLTHTLPVSSASVLNVKVLVSVFWLIVAIAMTIFSLFLVSTDDPGKNLQINLTLLNYEIQAGTGLSLGTFLFAAAILLIVICLSSTLMVTASLSVGQLFRQYRIPAAIGAYIVFYMVQQIVSVVLLITLGIAQLESFEQMHTQISMASYDHFFQYLFLLILLETAVFAVLYYILCYVITKKHLNLE